MVTPIRNQYLLIKKKYPETIVLFRLGDFYETFDEDALVTSKELQIVLTSREMGKGHKVPMAGIPYHALDNYLAKLIGKGHKVAVCEQLSEPGKGRDLVDREVVRVITPGTVTEPGLIEDKSNNFLVSVAAEGDKVGLAYVDVSTSEFGATQMEPAQLQGELARLHPSELLLPKGLEAPDGVTASMTRLDEFSFDLQNCRQSLVSHFKVSTLEGFGLTPGMPLAIRAAGALVQYLQETQKGFLKQIDRLSTYSVDAFMRLDSNTVRNLEIYRNTVTGTLDGSLLSVIDLTRTAMGGRLLKSWLGRPLLKAGEISMRLDAVALFKDDELLRKRVTSLLGQVVDLERLINRVRCGSALPRELLALKQSLEVIPELRGLLDAAGEGPAWLATSLKPFPEVVSLLAAAVSDNPPSSFSEGGVIRAGFSDELDNIKASSRDAKQYLANLERKEKDRTGIKSLKVSYNKVFGYYIEISKANLEQAPSDYIRKQTLTTGERFVTPELKEYESVILNARERIEELETTIFRQVCRQVAGPAEGIMAAARSLAALDVLSALAEVAARESYVRPELAEDGAISIAGGRHPVVERSLPRGTFVPNDCVLSTDDVQIVILTGPNMSGKSTYLRQVALIVLLAQIGSFVPAASARIGLVDRIFTRIGAHDDIATGRSTFMVEMTETANILHNATARSLIVLDEIGRGTSTYDGLSIARSVVEYLHNNSRVAARTLFATHYNELVELAGYLPRVKNYNIAVSEEGGQVVFLRKIVPGGADRSYGIHVAQLAGLPRAVVGRAHQILAELEHDRPSAATVRRSRKPASPPDQQLQLFGAPNPVLEELGRIDVNSLTPLEALTRLYELQKKLQGCRAEKQT